MYYPIQPISDMIIILTIIKNCFVTLYHYYNCNTHVMSYHYYYYWYYVLFDVLLFVFCLRFSFVYIFILSTCMLSVFFSFCFRFSIALPNTRRSVSRPKQVRQAGPVRDQEQDVGVAILVTSRFHQGLYQTCPVSFSAREYYGI